MAAFLWPFSQVMAEERVQGRRSLVLENDRARLVLDIVGGSIPRRGTFRVAALADQSTRP